MPNTPTFALRPSPSLTPATISPDLPRVGVFHAAVDVEDVAGTPRRTSFRSEMEHGLGDVLRQHVYLEHVALTVVVLELFGLYAVGGGPLLAPLRAPDPGPLQNRVGVDGVHPDALGSSLLCQAPREVQLGGLRRGVGARVLAGRHGVLGGDEDDAPSDALLLHDAEGFARDEEVASGEDGVVLVPHLDARLFDGGAGGEAGVRHAPVSPAVLEDRAPVGEGHLILVGYVGPRGDARFRQTLRDLACALLVEVADYHASPLRCE